jgi:hypothetical protein
MLNNSDRPAPSQNGQQIPELYQAPYDFTKYTISRGTANFLSCVRLLHDFVHHLLGALECEYGEDQADAIYSERFYEEINCLEGKIFEFIRSGVTQRMITNQI